MKVIKRQLKLTFFGFKYSNTDSRWRFNRDFKFIGRSGLHELKIGGLEVTETKCAQGHLSKISTPYVTLEVYPNMVSVTLQLMYPSR